MQPMTLSFDVTANMPEKPLDFFLNVNGIIQNIKIDKEVTHVSQVFADVDSTEYKIMMVMSGKTDDHTIIDGDKVVESAELKINNFKFDEYNFDKIITKQAIYYHNNNGYSEDCREPFDFVLGCNGAVTFEFTTPLYLWLLENSE